MRAVSNLIIGIALALVVLAVGVFAYNYLRQQAARATGTTTSEPGIACWAFKSNTTYILFIVNYLDRPLENVRVTYNASSVVQAINITRLDPGINNVTLPGKPIACTEGQASVYVKLVNDDAALMSPPSISTPLPSPSPTPSPTQTPTPTSTPSPTQTTTSTTTTTPTTPAPSPTTTTTPNPRPTGPAPE